MICNEKHENSTILILNKNENNSIFLFLSTNTICIFHFFHFCFNFYFRAEVALRLDSDIDAYLSSTRKLSVELSKKLRTQKGHSKIQELRALTKSYDLISFDESCWTLFFSSCYSGAP